MRNSAGITTLMAANLTKTLFPRTFWFSPVTSNVQNACQIFVAANQVRPKIIVLYLDDIVLCPLEIATSTILVETQFC